MPKAKPATQKSAKPATKTAKAKKTALHQHAQDGTPPERLVTAALSLLAETDWQHLQLADVARAARLPLGDLIGLCPGKAALLALLIEWLSARTADVYVPEPGSTHDRVFEVAMSWFEALEPHRAAVAALHEGLVRDPIMLLAARHAIIAATSFLLTLAEADTGPALPARALGLAAALGRAIPVWLNDDADLSKTMACIDGDLSRGERLMRFAMRRRQTEPGTDAEP